MNYYGTFNPGQEQWYPDDEKPIRKCDSCGCDLFDGEDGYEMDDGSIVCDDCFDKWTDGLRREMRILIQEGV